MSIIQEAMKAAIGLAPESWLPGGTPDPLMTKHGLIGKPVSRIDGTLKVQGKARFAAEVSLPGLAYASLLYSAIARGRIATIETAEAEAAPGRHRRRRTADPTQHRCSATRGTTAGG